MAEAARVAKKRSKTSAAARKKSAEALEAEGTPSRQQADDNIDRTLGRAIAWTLPLGTFLVALVVAFVVSMGPALLIAAAGVLLGTVALFWASIRTLTGDAPLPEGFELSAAANEKANALTERKAEVLRALKDLEHEHSVGKIDDADFQTLSARYRDEAKNVLRELDEQVKPYRERAERLAKNHLAKINGTAAPSEKSLPTENDSEKDLVGLSDSKRATASNACPSCEKQNDADARFCKHCGAAIPSAKSEQREEETDAHA